MLRNFLTKTYRTFQRPRHHSTLKTSSNHLYPFAFNAQKQPLLIDVSCNIADPQLKHRQNEHFQNATNAGIHAMLVPSSSVSSCHDILNLTQQIKQRNNTTKPSIESMDGELWGTIVAGNVKTWQLDTNRHAKKSNEGIKWRIKYNYFPKIFTTAGIHPFETDRIQDTKTTMTKIEKLAKMHPNSITAIGECGLDFSPGFPSHVKQTEIFQQHVQLAIHLQLPLFLHVRDAFKETFEILDQASSTSTGNKTMPPIIIHCFTGTETDLNECMQRGYKISLSGLICRTNKQGKDLCQAVKNIFVNNKNNPSFNYNTNTTIQHSIMVETDAPYLGFKHCRTGYVHDSKKTRPNVPSSLPMIVQQLANILEEEVEDVAINTRNAAVSFFGKR